MAERLILHAGMPKAGSSALQATLARAHPALLRKGVLYPKTWEGHQNFAVSGIVSYARLPRLYKQAYAGHASDLQYDFSKYWSHIVRQIDKHNPRTVILSGEAFFRDLSAAELETVRALLSPLAKVLEVVFYVRRPSEYYLSSVQQALKASHKLKRIRAVKYRAKIEPYMDIADKVHVISFNRDLFANNDIAMDFAGRFISDCLPEISTASAKSINETVSAEAMSILQAYREHNHLNRNDVHTTDSSLLVELLKSTERQASLFERPKLRAEIANNLDCLSSDVSWLQDNFGVSFGICEKMAQDSNKLVQPVSVDCICDIDLNNRDRLLMLVISRLLNKRQWYSPLLRWITELYNLLFSRRGIKIQRKSY